MLSLWGARHRLCDGLTRRELLLPAAVTLPEPIINNPRDPWPGQNAGFLGRAWDPWLLPCDPSAADFRVPEVGLPDDMPALRLDGRRRLVDQVNRHLDGLERHQVVARHGGFARQAFDVLLRNRARKAFALFDAAAAARTASPQAQGLQPLGFQLF